MTKHEQSDHFGTSSGNQVLQNAREDQIRRLLQDIWFLPGTARTDKTDVTNEET